MRMRMLLRLGAGVMVVAGVGAVGYIAGAQEEKKRPPEKTLKVNQVARVGESIISAEEFIERVNEIERAMNPEKRVAQAALDLLVGERLLELEADRIEAVVKAREVGDEMAKLEQQWRSQHEREQAERVKDQRSRGAPENPEPWEDWLKRRAGMTPAEFSAWIRTHSTRNIRLRLVVGFWEETNEHAEAWGISCRTEKEATDLRNRVLKGESFSTLAREASTSNQDTGGKIGMVWRNDGRLDPEVDEAFWKLKDGAISQPVKTEHAWWIVLRKVTVLANQAPFYDLREELLKRPNVDSNRFQAWRNAVASGGRYAYERRMPGWDCAANQP